MKLSECAYGRVSESGMSHKPSNMLCLPFRMMFLFSSNTWRNFLLKWLDIHHHIYDQLILSMNFVMLKRPGFLLQQVGVLRVSDRIAVFPLCYYQVFQLRDPFFFVELILMHGHHLGWSSSLSLWCLHSRWFMVVVLQQFYLSAEEDLFYYLYLASLSLSTPLVGWTHMWFHCAYWRRFVYPGAWALYCCMLLLHVHTSRVSRNIYWKSLVRACEVPLSWFIFCLASAGVTVVCFSSPSCSVCLHLNQQLLHLLHAG